MATIEKRGQFWRVKVRRAGLPAQTKDFVIIAFRHGILRPDRHFHPRRPEIGRASCRERVCLGV